MATKVILSEDQFRDMVRKNMYVSKGTVYDYQLCFKTPSGYIVSVPHSSDLVSRKELEEILIEQVIERWQYE